jgi:hypothetical protein
MPMSSVVSLLGFIPKFATISDSMVSLFGVGVFALFLVAATFSVLKKA